MNFSFAKMTGLGNTFVLIDGYATPVEKLIPHVAFICDPSFGIGADGVIFVLPPQGDGDYYMRIFNSDGSEAEMCGNGIRCFAAFVDEFLGFSKKECRVETLSGTKSIVKTAAGYRVNMGVPQFEVAQIPIDIPGPLAVSKAIEVGNTTYSFTALSMGNPHAVIFADELTDYLVTKQGPRIETHDFFPNKTNVEFIRIRGRNEVDMRVWERGCGETMACGTGACAAAAAGIIENRLSHSVTVHLPGGDLLIEWNKAADAPLFMTGAAHTVFTGTMRMDKNTA
ncbi:MAG: diaminopimelate epimerase [Fibrobacterota bacterium]